MCNAAASSHAQNAVTGTLRSFRSFFMVMHIKMTDEEEDMRALDVQKVGNS